MDPISKNISGLLRKRGALRKAANAIFFMNKPWEKAELRLEQDVGNYWPDRGCQVKVKSLYWRLTGSEGPISLEGCSNRVIKGTTNRKEIKNNYFEELFK